MKYLKVRVRRHQKGISYARRMNLPIMIYPDGYNQVHFEVAGYIEENNITYVLGAVKDDDSGLSKVLESSDVTELTKDEAIAFSEKNEKRIERITDEAKVRRLEIKAKYGEPLTPDEKKALDPNDPTPGIEKGKILADKF